MLGRREAAILKGPGAGRGLSMSRASVSGSPKSATTPCKQPSGAGHQFKFKILVMLCRRNLMLRAQGCVLGRVLSIPTPSVQTPPIFLESGGREEHRHDWHPERTLGTGSVRPPGTTPPWCCCVSSGHGVCVSPPGDVHVTGAVTSCLREFSAPY